MFRIKPINSNVMTTPKPSKINNVPINVVVDITICSQQLQQVFKERELVKPKELKIGNEKNVYVINLMKL